MSGAHRTGLLLNGHRVLVGPMNEVWVWSVVMVAQSVSVCDACELYT